MNDLFESIGALYSNRENFIVIGLTGRTGSGCSTAAQILSSKSEKIKLPKPLGLNENEERKYRICYNFINKNWTPFVWIQLKDVITSFILENDYDKFKNYVSATLCKGKYSKEDIERTLNKKIKFEYDKLHNLRLEIRKLREKSEKSEVINRLEVAERRKRSYGFYFKIVPPFTEKLKSTLSELSGDIYTTVYQKVGDNIRSSGNAFIEKYDTRNIHRLAIRVNKIIKIFTKRSKSTKEKVLIVIDAIRNPFEAVYFRERYSAFYLVSVNTPKKDRIHRLKKILNLTDNQLENIDKKEDEKTLEGPDFF